MAPRKSRTFKLDAHHIRINTVDIQTFFAISPLPAPTVDPVILQHADLDHAISLKLPDDLRLFYIYLRDSTDRDHPTCIDDFTRHLLGNILHIGLARIRSTFPFIMDGRRFNILHDVSVSREGYQIILVQRSRVSVPVFHVAVHL